jgi:hypothetical protein
MKLHTSMFYAYQDQYGWAIATVTGAPSHAFTCAYRAPRTFATRADADQYIEEACK